MKRRFVFAILGACSALGGANARVRIEHGKFYDGAKEFHPIGGTFSLLHGEVARREAVSAIERAGQLGLNVARVWLFSEGPAREPEPWERQFFFRMGPGAFFKTQDSSPFRVMDDVLTAAKRTGVKLIFVMGNHWTDYGGIARYSEWFTGSPAAPGGSLGRGPTDDELEFFYTDRRAIRAYRSAVSEWLNRIHSEGVSYKNHPALMGVELLNEPRKAPRIADSQMTWFRDTARWVKSIAPQVLVAAGSETGIDANLETSDHWKRLAQIPEMDWIDLHLYPGEGHPWTPNTLSQFEVRVRSAASFAKQIAMKPLLLSELGMAPAAAARMQESAGLASTCVNTGSCLVDLARRARQFPGVEGVMLWVMRANAAESGPHWVELTSSANESWLRAFSELKARVLSR